MRAVETEVETHSPGGASDQAMPVAGEQRIGTVISDLGKRYVTTWAIRGVSLDIRPGEVHGLVGHNGAGKSTIVKILSGAIKPDLGTVAIDGEAVPGNPAGALSRGVRCIYQHRTLLPNLSVAENVALLDRGSLRYARGSAHRLARERLERLGCDVDLRAEVGRLGPGVMQEIEIARALDDECRLMIFDEPTTSLSAREVRRLRAVMEQVRRLGVCILFVSHDLDVVVDVSDRITVLRDGRTEGTVLAASTSRSTLVGRMLGETVVTRVRPDDPGAPRRLPSSTPLFEVDAVRAERLASTSIGFHSGEVVGVVGSLDSGVEALGRVLGGAQRPASGTLRLSGRPVAFRSVGEALRSGVVYVPDDRTRYGLFENLLPGRQIGISKGTLKRSPFLSRRREEQDAAALAHDTGLPEHHLRRAMTALSGGNQQKVLIARALACQPTVLVAHAPTVGVDVGSRAAIHGLLRTLADRGAIVILVSNDAQEVDDVADRAIVLRGGRVVLESFEFSESLLLSEITGADARAAGAPLPAGEG